MVRAQPRSNQAAVIRLERQEQRQAAVLLLIGQGWPEPVSVYPFDGLVEFPIDGLQVCPVEVVQHGGYNLNQQACGQICLITVQDGLDFCLGVSRTTDDQVFDQPVLGVILPVEAGVSAVGVK
jgi:hypothetical protein